MSWFVKLASVKPPEDVHGEGHDYEPGALESHAHWQVIWPRAVARAWADPDFKRRLLENAEKTIEEQFDYDMKNLKLKVIEDPNNTPFDSSMDGPDGEDPWKGLPDMELTMYLPAPPDTGLQAVAITAYEDTGRTYPFTCC